MEVLQIILLFIPAIIAVISFTRWARKEDDRIIKIVNDAFNKAEVGTTLDPDDIPEGGLDFLDSERPFISLSNQCN